MKRNSLFILCFCFVNIYCVEVFSQCSIEKLFPIKFYTSKYNSIALFSSNKNVNKIMLSLDIPVLKDGWVKDKERDSIYLSSLNIDYSNNECLRGKEIRGYLQFANDSLNGWEISANYSLGNYNLCKEDFDNIVALFKKRYPCYHLDNLLSKEENNAKRGQSYCFYLTQKRMDSISQMALEFPLIELLEADSSIEIELMDQSEPYYNLKINYNNPNKLQ